MFVGMLQSSYDVYYKQCDGSNPTQVNFNEYCKGTSCNITTPGSAGTAYIVDVYSVSNDQRSFNSTNSSAVNGKLQKIVPRHDCYHRYR